MIQGSLPTTDLAIVAGLAGAAFAVMNGLVGVLREAIRKRNGVPNAAYFSSADRVILGQVHQKIEESESQRRRMSDAIENGFHEMGHSLEDSLAEDVKQTEILQDLVRSISDENRARRAE